MRIRHTAILVEDLDRAGDFYSMYFGAREGDTFSDPSAHTRSCFLSFSGTQIELIQKKGLTAHSPEEHLGYGHISFSAGSIKRVHEVTERLRSDGYTVLQEPGTTPDGFYQSTVLDPEGNKIEITI